MTLQQTRTPGPGPTRAWDSLRTLLPYLRQYRRQCALGLFVLVLASLIAAVPPLYIGAAIDSLSGRLAPMSRLGSAGGALMRTLVPFYRPDDLRTVIGCCALLVGAILLKNGCVYGSRWMLARISRDLEYTLRRDLLGRLVTLDREFYVRNRTGELMSRVTNDLASVQAMIDTGVTFGVTTLLTMALAIVMMVRLSPSLTLWVLIPVPIIWALVRYFGPRIHRRYADVQRTLGVLSARLHENVTGSRVLRAYGQEPAEIRAFDKINEEYLASNRRLVSTRALLMPSMQVSFGLAFLLVLWQGGREVMLERVSLGTLIAFYAYIGQVVGPIGSLGQLATMFQGGAASMARVDYILSARPKTMDAAVAPSGRGIRGTIEFRHLDFRYPPAANGDSGSADERPPVLQDICLRIPEGSTCAIIGPTVACHASLPAKSTAMTPFGPRYA